MSTGNYNSSNVSLDQATVAGPTYNLEAYSDEYYRDNTLNGSKFTAELGTYFSNYGAMELQSLSLPNALNVLTGRNVFQMMINAVLVRIELNDVASSSNPIAALSGTQLAYLLSNTVPSTGGGTLVSRGITVNWGNNPVAYPNEEDRCFQFKFDNQSGFDIYPVYNSGGILSTMFPLLGFKIYNRTTPWGAGIHYTDTYPNIHPTKNIYLMMDGAADPTTTQGSNNNPMRAPFKAVLTTDAGGIQVYQSRTGEGNIVPFNSHNNAVGRFRIWLEDDGGQEINLKGGNYVIGVKFLNFDLKYTK